MRFSILFICGRPAVHRCVMPISKEKILAQHMHRIADEIFKFEDLEKSSYSAFTAETCHRQLKGLPVVDNFENAYPKLLTCKA
jgi:hypothetical protein